MPSVSILERRLSHFVDWLAPDSAREKEIRAKAQEIRTRIREQAAADGLIIAAMPNAGSFEKRTGLRRHNTGGSDVDGLDVDLPFVVKPRTRDDQELEALLDRFDRYAEASYPGTRRKRTRSSIVLELSGKRLNFDLVPMLATGTPGRQILIRAGGERIETSIGAHVEFVRQRTRDSNGQPGRVKFNECVRLIKWWREFRPGNRVVKMPSFLLELLCANAYDACKVEPGYAATLRRWFEHVAGVAQRRQALNARGKTALHRGAEWMVLDPVNARNNVVAGWSAWDIDALAACFTGAAELCQRAMDHDAKSDAIESRRCLIELFGTPFKHYCGD